MVKSILTYVLFLYIFLSNTSFLYAKNIDIAYEKDIFHLSMYDANQRYVDLIGEITSNSSSGISFDMKSRTVGGLVDQAKMTYSKLNLPKAWSSNVDHIKDQGFNISDFFNILYLYDHELNGKRTSQSHYPKTFRNRNYSNLLKVYTSQNPSIKNDPFSKEVVKANVKLFNKAINIDKPSCYKGRNVIMIKQSGRDVINYQNMNINYTLSYTYYLDEATGLISGIETLEMSAAGQKETLKTHYVLNFLKKNCGPDSGEINKNVEEFYLDKFNKGKLYASLTKDNYQDKNIEQVNSNNSNIFDSKEEDWSKYKSFCKLSKSGYVAGYFVKRNCKSPAWKNATLQEYIAYKESRSSIYIEEESNVNLTSNTGFEYFYCENNKNDVITKYSTNYRKECPVGSSKTTELAWINYESQINQMAKDNDYNSFAKLMSIELDKHFNKNDDYYILGLDNKGNKLVGSAKFIDPYASQPISRGNYYYLKDTYDETISKPCFFTSTAQSNRIISNELRARGSMILECNGKNLPGLWEQKGNVGTFVTNDKSIYGVFKKTKFNYLGTYLLPKNIYKLASANNIYDNVRSGTFEDPRKEYDIISRNINLASSQFYQNQSSSDLASSKDSSIFNPKEEDWSKYKSFCKLSKSGYVAGYFVKRNCKGPAWKNATLQEYIAYKESRLNQTPNVDNIFNTSQVKIVNATPLNVRETPNGQWLSILSKGEKVAILEKNNDNTWNKIISEDGQIGWVSSKYLVDDLSNLEDNNKNLNVVKKNNEIIQDKEPEIIVTKNTFDEIEPSISCSEKEIFTKEKTALIDCKITDNDKVFKVYIEGNEVNLRADRIQEKYPVVIGKSELEIRVFDMSGNETKEFVFVEREFSFVNKVKQFDPLKPGLINAPINKNRIAIIVGIKDYKDIPDTKYADRDAFTFIDYANETLGINNSNIKYFINDDAGFFDFKTIDKWLSTKINKNTEVFFFYSGHGANNNGQSLLLPSDFRTDLIDDTSITKESFLQQIVDQNPKHIFAFFDACFSGLSRDGETLIAGLRNISIVEEEVPFSNITIFNSASGAEFSSDFDEVGHGLFSYFLMKGLEGKADANSDQQISASELHNYIYTNVSKQSIILGPAQNPSLISNDDQIIVKW